METRTRRLDELRVLASPASVLALVVLAVNDHVLKQAYPGVITGKLSDVAGLIFFPILLTVPLTLVLPRAHLVAATATGLVFAAVKTSPDAAAVVSSLWSLGGTPTHMLADPTDLLALPAIAVALGVRRRVLARPPTPWRRHVAMAIGMGVLPLGVLATSATSPCAPLEGTTQVGVLRGDYFGGPGRTEERLVIGYGRVSLTSAGEMVRLAPYDTERITDYGPARTTACTREDECWRIGDGDGGGLVIEHRAADGDWTSDFELSADELGAQQDDLEESCDEPAIVGAVDIATLPADDGGTIVVVAAQRLGVIVRWAEGSWEQLAEDDLYQQAADPPDLEREDRLVPVEPDP